MDGVNILKMVAKDFSGPTLPSLPPWEVDKISLSTRLQTLVAPGARVWERVLKTRARPISTRSKRIQNQPPSPLRFEQKICDHTSTGISRDVTWARATFLQDHHTVSQAAIAGACLSVFIWHHRSALAGGTHARCMCSPLSRTQS